MSALQWMWNDLPKRLSFEFQYLGLPIKVEQVGTSMSNQFPRIGVPLRSLGLRMDAVEARKSPYRVHWAVGTNNKIGETHELGKSSPTPLWIGLSVYTGAETISKPLHDKIFEKLRDPLQRVCPALNWQSRHKSDKWSIYAYVPTEWNEVGTLSAECYQARLCMDFRTSYSVAAQVLATIDI